MTKSLTKAVFSISLSTFLLVNTVNANTSFCESHQSHKYLYCNDFESSELGPYTTKHLKKEWPNLQSLSTKFPLMHLGVWQGRVEIDNQNKNQVMKIHYPKDKYGSWASGASWIMSLESLQDKNPYEQLSLEYKVMFKEGFLFDREGLFGGKLPGLKGGETISGGETADGRNGWTSRIMWGQKGRGLGYLYYPDMRDDTYNQQACPRYGLDHELCVIKRNKYFTSENNSNRKCLSEWAADEYDLRFETGRFYKIKQQIKMNTLPEAVNGGIPEGNRDGELKIWVNDQLMLDCRNIRYRDVPELGIDAILFNTFFGGNTPESSAHPHDETIYFDDFLVTE